MPSVAFALSLLLAAGGPTTQPPERARDATTSPTVATPASPRARKPADATAPQLPTAPYAAKPAAPAAPARDKAIAGRAEESTGEIQVPEEQVMVDADGNIKVRTQKRQRRKAAVTERTEAPERKNPWSTDRYAAVVPPGLTLAALRSQLNKSGVTAQDSPAPLERSPSSQTLSDIEKAREALRQETARLEALLRASGNCGGSAIGIGMPVGDSVLPAPVSQAALREAAGEQIDSVSRAMKGMKPEQAAAVVARLDRGLAAEILRRMKASDAGAILGFLKPELAADLATEIAVRKPSLPKDKKGGSK